MRYLTFRDNCIFFWNPGLEAVWGAISLLGGQRGHSLCTEIYGEEQIALWQRQYRFLFETFQAIRGHADMNMLDLLLDMDLSTLSRQAYADAVLATPAAEFLWRILSPDFYCPEADVEVLRRAVNGDDDALDTAYGWVAEQCGSFLSFSALLRQFPRFVRDFFALCDEMDDRRLEAALERYAGRVDTLARELTDAGDPDPLVLSERLMGKRFRNRGPYDTFCFAPSLLMPVSACRFFHIQGGDMRQILFLTLRKTRREQEDTVRALKAMADPTRYQILTLLASEGPMRGMDISRHMGIAASTVSHHMEQMKPLITEEPVKNAKFYGLSAVAARELLEDIAEDLRIQR